MTEETSGFGRPDALKTILLGGLTAGVLDLTYAVVFFWFYAGAPPRRIFQAIAAGVYGKEASQAGGWSTAVQGILLHFVIATLIAIVFYLGTRFLPVLYKKPVICGLIYGVICFFVMNLVVVPLSNAPAMPMVITPPFIGGILIHALGIGLPIALIAAWSAKKN